MKFIERAFRVIAPHNCVVCNREGSLLCAWCAIDACPPLPDRCYKCNQLSPLSRVCQRCRAKTSLQHVCIRAEYGGVAKQLIHALKFERARAAAAEIAALMSEALPYLDEDVQIVHVPTATSRARLRGYDQAKLIARELAGLLSRLHLTLLAREGQLRQVGSKGDERRKQLAGRFRPVQAHMLKGAHILLVDDVLTTGATLEEAAKVLKKAGAKTVDALVFARVQL